jgi:hypothetical protein
MNRSSFFCPTCQPPPRVRRARAGVRHSGSRSHSGGDPASVSMRLLETVRSAGPHPDTPPGGHIHGQGSPRLHGRRRPPRDCPART